MHATFLSFLASAIVISPLTWALPAGSGTPINLRPIAIRDYEAATGLRPREDRQFADLDLETASQLVYGSAGNHGQLLMANMTLFAPDGLEMIMMERFEGLTTHVDCKGDDGEMSLTFESQAAFDYAIQTWSHINKKKEDKFILIANHDGCGPDDERQSYFISKVTPDAKSLTTFLAAQPAPWSEVAGTYDMDFGHAFAGPNHIDRRWNPFKKIGHAIGKGFEGVVDAGKDIVKGAGKLIEKGIDEAEHFIEEGADFAGDVFQAIQGNADVKKSLDFPVNVRSENQRTEIWSDNSGRLKLDCVNCFVAGKFVVTGRVSVHHFSLKEFSVAAAPNNLHAGLVFEASVNSLQGDNINQAKELFSAPIPGIGIAVPGIFKLGGVLAYEVGFSAGFKGAAKVDFGLKASIPDNSILYLSLSSPSKSKAAGFSPKVEPVFEVKQLDASLSVSAYSQPKIFFGVEVLSAAKADLTLTLRLPEVSATFTPKYDEQGACTHAVGAPKTGVDIDSSIKLAVYGGAEAKLLGWGKDYSRELIGYAWPIFDKCIPISLPGIGGAKGTTPTIPTIPKVSSHHGSGWWGAVLDALNKKKVQNLPATIVGPKLPIKTLPAKVVGPKFPGFFGLSKFPIAALPTAQPVVKGPKGLVLPPPLQSSLQKTTETAPITFKAGFSSGILPSNAIPMGAYSSGLLSTVVYSSGRSFTASGGVSVYPSGSLSTGVIANGTGKYLSRTAKYPIATPSRFADTIHQNKHDSSDNHHLTTLNPAKNQNPSATAFLSISTVTATVTVTHEIKVKGDSCP